MWPGRGSGQSGPSRPSRPSISPIGPSATSTSGGTQGVVAGVAAATFDISTSIWGARTTIDELPSAAVVGSDGWKSAAGGWPQMKLPNHDNTFVPL